MTARPLLVLLLATSASSCAADSPARHATETTASPEEIAAAAEPLTLAGRTIERTLPLGAEARERLAPAVGREDPRALVVRFEGISWQASPGLHYEVYVNLPPGGRPDPEGPHYAGNLSFYGPATGASDQAEELSVVEPLRALAERGLWSADTPLTVTLVPRGPVLAPGEPAPTLPTSEVSIRRIVLLAAR